VLACCWPSGSSHPSAARAKCQRRSGQVWSPAFAPTSASCFTLGWSSPRACVRYHLGPLNLAETIAYVRHHIRVAGYLSGPLFTDDALDRIFEYTKGLPRRINQVCTTALMAGVIDKHSVLDESTVRKAIADLDHA